MDPVSEAYSFKFPLLKRSKLLGPVTSFTVTLSNIYIYRKVQSYFIHSYVAYLAFKPVSGSSAEVLVGHS